MIPYKLLIFDVRNVTIIILKNTCTFLLEMIFLGNHICYLYNNKKVKYIFNLYNITFFLKFSPFSCFFEWSLTFLNHLFYESVFNNNYKNINDEIMMSY